MKRLIVVSCVLIAAAIHAVEFAAQTEDVREATGLPIEIGTHVIFGHVKVRGLAANERKPSIYVVLYVSGFQIDRVRANDRGYYYFLRSASDGASLVFEVDNAEAGRVNLTSGVGSTVRRDVEVAWRPPKSSTSAAPGVVSVRASYSRSSESEKAFDKGIAAIRAKNTAEALTIFKQIVSKDSKDFVAWTELGSLYFGDLKFSEAQEAYGKALELKPDFMVALMNLGKLYLNQKQPEKAVITFTKAATADLTSANAFHYLGEAYLQLKQGSKAVIALNESIRLAPTEKATLHLRLAALYDAAGLKDRAANEYKLFLAKNPDYAEKESMEKYIKEHAK